MLGVSAATIEATGVGERGVRARDGRGSPPALFDADVAVALTGAAGPEPHDGSEPGRRVDRARRRRGDPRAGSCGCRGRAIDRPAGPSRRRSTSCGGTSRAGRCRHRSAALRRASRAGATRGRPASLACSSSRSTRPSEVRDAVAIGDRPVAGRGSRRRGGCRSRTVARDAEVPRVDGRRTSSGGCATLVAGRRRRCTAVRDAGSTASAPSPTGPGGACAVGRARRPVAVGSRGLAPALDEALADDVRARDARASRRT